MRYTPMEKIKQSAQERSLEFIGPEFTVLARDYTWKCLLCNLEFVSSAANVIRKTKNGCIHCAMRKFNLDTIQEYAKKKGLLFLSERVATISEKYLWKCGNGHEWRTTINSIDMGYGCPYCCTGVSEEKCRFVLESLTGYKFVKTRTLLSGLELDGFCSEMSLAFEHQGRQHFEPVMFYKDNDRFAQQIERDHKKRDMCKQLNIELIEIPYNVSSSRDKLEQFIRERLPDCSGTVDWSGFNANPSEMSKIMSRLQSQNISCLTPTYDGHNKKMSLRCNKCSYEWERTPNKIKILKGCPKCNKRAPHSTNEIQSECLSRNIVFEDEYKNMKTKYQFRCLLCSHVWKTKFNCIQRAKCCPKCAKRSAVLKRKATQKVNSSCST